jgi:hypothetical protein
MRNNIGYFSKWNTMFSERVIAYRVGLQHGIDFNPPCPSTHSFGSFITTRMLLLLGIILARSSKYHSYPLPPLNLFLASVVVK